MRAKPVLAITVGDPAGIGPEVTARALADSDVRDLARYVVFGDRRLWRTAAGAPLAEFDFATTTGDEFTGPDDVPKDQVLLVEFPGIDYDAIPVGRASAAGGEASIRYLIAAIEGIKAGRLDALVTGPISKAAVQAAGYSWPGHTELLAEKFGATDVAMMFAGGPFRVVLATIHMSLADVLRTLDRERIVRVVRLAADALGRYFAVASPRVAVCGLNPHAGEGGRFGDEEARIIIPAIEEVRAGGIDAVGPLPADTVFRAAMDGRYDIVVAMYHDQGLIPIKTMAFEESVNVTIGIPTIRTSVDHGTAFDIAGQGAAEASSMKSAIRMAIEMLRADKK